MSDEADSDLLAPGDADDDFAYRGGATHAAGGGGGGERKRRAHNETEQRRAKRINESIERVRAMLQEAGITPPRDKAGVLADSVAYFAGLQQRVDELTAFIRAAGLHVPPSGSGGEPHVPAAPVAAPRSTAHATHAPVPAGVPPRGADGEVDFESVFMHSSLPQVISSVDGRFLQCSDLFCKVTGYTREEVLSRSIFNLTPSEYLPHTFALVGEMMSEAATPSDASCAAFASGRAGGRKRARGAADATGPSSASVISSSRAFNKVCKMKSGLALVHVRMSLVKDAGSDDVKYLLCTILPMSSTGDAATPGVPPMPAPIPAAAALPVQPPPPLQHMYARIPSNPAADGSMTGAGVAYGAPSSLMPLNGFPEYSTAELMPAECTPSMLDGLTPYPYAGETESPIDVLSLVSGVAAQPQPRPGGGAAASMAASAKVTAVAGIPPIMGVSMTGASVPAGASMGSIIAPTLGVALGSNGPFTTAAYTMTAPAYAPVLPAHAVAAWDGHAGGMDARPTAWAAVAQPTSAAGMALAQAMLAATHGGAPGARLPMCPPPPAPGQNMTVNGPFVPGAWDCHAVRLRGGSEPAPGQCVQQHEPQPQQFVWSPADMLPTAAAAAVVGTAATAAGGGGGFS